MSNDEYVRSVWDFGFVGIYGYGGTAKYLNFSLIGKEVMGANEAQMWELAAEFTRERLEQVRQLREEIETMGVLTTTMFYAKSEGILPSAPNRYEACKRITPRLEAELARLTAGMKPAALEGAAR